MKKLMIGLVLALFAGVVLAETDYVTLKRVERLETLQDRQEVVMETSGDDAEFQDNVDVLGDLSVSGAVTIVEGALANYTVVASDIVSNTITASQLAADSVEASELANDSVASANIINYTIANADVASNAAIVASKLDLTSPGAIGTTAPAAGEFTTLTVNDVVVGDDVLFNGVQDGFKTVSSGQIAVMIGGTNIATIQADGLHVDNVYGYLAGHGANIQYDVWDYTTNTIVLTDNDYNQIQTISTNAAVAITLPANGAPAGTWVDVAVHGSANDDCAPTIAAATADTLITTNSADSDSVTFDSGHRIGAHVHFWSDGSFWHAENRGGTAMTVNDSD